ncbi:MAG: SIR2 family protein [Bacteroidales bacterium]|jgi:hypothetical protein|nr:SIR2 family protein [Bacteroidales bacterium]
MKNELYRKIKLMQNSLIDCATGRGYNVKDYEDTRQLIMNNISLKKGLFNGTCHDFFNEYSLSLSFFIEERRRSGNREMIRTIDLAQFLRIFKIAPNGQMAFFLGSGASIQAGIPTGFSFVWEFKKEIYCSKTGTSLERFKDLQSEENKSILQDYFDAESNNPKLYDPAEYSHYFEKCYPTSSNREQFIREKVRDIKPSLGYNCLGDFIIKGKIKNVWTTNFDELIEAGIKQLEAGFSFRVISSANKDSINIVDERYFPNIYKLHGDYRYDKIKNTIEEVQRLETVMNQKFENSLFSGGLIVVGYSGSDESTMSILEKNIARPGFLPCGLIWLKHRYSNLSERTVALMDKACEKNENSGIIKIDGFDEFMYSCYQYISGDNEKINYSWKDLPNRRLSINFASPKVDYFIKLNTFESISIPKPVSFDTNITSWKELRTIVGAEPLLAALFARKIYCFDSLERIHRIFKNYVLSDPVIEDVPLKYLYRNESFYTSMLYDLIRFSLLKKENIAQCGRNKYYNSQKQEQMTENYISYYVYDAIEIGLEFINGKYHLSVLLTVYITDKDGKPVNKDIRKTMTNKKMSTIWNASYNEKLKDWNRLLYFGHNKAIEFVHEGFNLQFNYACITYGNIAKTGNFPQKIAYQFDEPIMLFRINNEKARGINQLRGISNYGPIDFSYTTNEQRYSIKLTIITPIGDLQKILSHLNSLKQERKMWKDDGFCPIYNGFEKIYKQDIDIPQPNDGQRCVVYDEKTILSKESLMKTLKEKIDNLSTESQNFTVLVIYIPAYFEQFRIGNSDEDFNLHDIIKLYAMDKGIKIQFIEEKSLNTYEPCKVMWALSASIYAKKGGILWRPEALHNNTAFVGVGYAVSKERGTSVGCSQLFDASGTGLRLLLRKINDPQFIHKNPFMKTDEARQMMGLLREQYYKSNPSAKLERIVIHKTTFFTQDEIQGFTQALEGIDDIELLQIQEFTPWRGIRYENISIDSNVYNYAIKRGTVLQLSDNRYLLWTHGCVKSEELKGKTMNYYKGGRGIPQPLMIKRFYGKATGDVLTKEILMLTKMNWNSGDSLYKNLPVTLDFAKILARMSKQKEALYDRLYDFRYFM